MTREEKQLLLKDLSGRLFYEVKGIYTKNGFTEPYVHELTPFYYGEIRMSLEGYRSKENYVEFKPYLRPMSSMTDDEREEIEVFVFNEWYQEDSCKIDKEGWIEILANYDVSGIDPGFCSDYVDWLNAHHFDYRGLIPMGLALEAPKDMYKTE